MIITNAETKMLSKFRKYENKHFGIVLLKAKEIPSSPAIVISKAVFSNLFILRNH